VNKSIIIIIPIIAILLGMYFVFSDTENAEESTIEIQPEDESEPKRYTQSLSEAVSVTTP
jgi:hypothetical protein